MNSSFPSLGDKSKVYTVEVTEPQINALGGLQGFIQGIATEVSRNPTWPMSFVSSWIKHYLPTLEGLGDRLNQLDEPDATILLLNGSRALRANATSRTTENAEESANT